MDYQATTNDKINTPEAREFRVKVVGDFLTKTAKYCKKTNMSDSDAGFLIFATIEILMATHLISGFSLEEMMDLLKHTPQRVLSLASDLEDLYEKANSTKTEKTH